MEYPSSADGRVHSDIPSLLARDIHNSPTDSYVPPPSPSFGQPHQQRSSHRQEAGLQPQRFSTKHMRHSRVNDYPETQFKRAQMTDHHVYFVLQNKLLYCSTVTGHNTSYDIKTHT